MHNKDVQNECTTPVRHPGIFILWALRIPAAAYHGTPLPDRCPYIGNGCGSICRYGFKEGDRQIDGRCLAKRDR